ncbi:tRNA pseudouridine(55) synthase TruB [Patescibacteria group bacterium]
MILNIHKEKNWTSFDVVAKVRGILGEKKVGHAGTLDPLAEGVLVVLTGEDTKKQSEFMNMEKEYIAEFGLGLDSDTYDLEVLPRVIDTNIDFEKEIKKYVGKIKQKVPSYSAVKVKGKKLYKEARKGKIDESSLPVKEISIHSIEILDKYEKDIETESGVKKIPIFKVKVVCGSGTYIRSLAHDLDCVLVSLVRTRIGDFKVEDSIEISEIKRSRPEREGFRS